MSKKAFTLIELAIVLLVIGILAGLLLRNLLGFTASARDTRRIGDLRNMTTYLTNYFLRKGTYPTTTDLGVLETRLREVGVLGAGAVLPRDPLAGFTYYYSYCAIGPSAATPTNYVIAARLESATRGQAANLYEGTITATPTGWTCVSNFPFASCTVDHHCLAQ